MVRFFGKEIMCKLLFNLLIFCSYLALRVSFSVILFVGRSESKSALRKLTFGNISDQLV